MHIPLISFFKVLEMLLEVNNRWHYNSGLKLQIRIQCRDSALGLGQTVRQKTHICDQGFGSGNWIYNYCITIIINPSLLCTFSGK